MPSGGEGENTRIRSPFKVRTYTGTSSRTLEVNGMDAKVQAGQWGLATKENPF